MSLFGDAMAIDASEAGHRLANLHSEYLFEHPTFPGLSEAERVYLAVWRFEAEVYNGGLAQLLTNSTGEYIPLIVEWLKLIGAEEVALVVQRAIDEVRSDPRCNGSIDRLVRRADDVRQRLFDLGDDLYPEVDNVLVKLFHYMSLRREQFDVAENFWLEEATQ